MNATSSHQRIVHGFSLIELMVVLMISVTIAAFAVPKYVTMRRSLRISGDNSSIAALVAEAKLRAAANFTHARVYADLNANTYTLEVWNKSGNSGAGCWQTEGDTAHSCTVAGVSPVQHLSQGVTFGVGILTTPPPNTQTTLAQAALCDTSYRGMPVSTIANTACIEFNSRGVPIDPSGAPSASGALYVSDGSSVFGSTLLASGLSQNWYSANVSTATWQQR